MVCENWLEVMGMERPKDKIITSIIRELRILYHHIRGILNTTARERF